MLEPKVNKDINPMVVNKHKQPIFVSKMEITEEQKSFLENMADQIPYYFLHYSEQIFDFILSRTSKKKNPLLYLLVTITKRGTIYVKNKFNA